MSKPRRPLARPAGAPVMVARLGPGGLLMLCLLACGLPGTDAVAQTTARLTALQTELDALAGRVEVLEQQVNGVSAVAETAVEPTATGPNGAGPNGSGANATAVAPTPGADPDAAVVPASFPTTGLVGELASLQQRAAGLEQALATAQTAATGRDEQFDALEEATQSARARLDDLQARLEALTARLATQQTDLATRIDTLGTQTQTQQTESQTRHDDLAKQVTDQQATLVALVPRVDDLAAQVGEHDRAIQGNEARIEDSAIKLFEALMAINNANQALRELDPRQVREPPPPATPALTTPAPAAPAPGAPADASGADGDVAADVADRGPAAPPPDRSSGQPVALWSTLLLPLGVMLWLAGVTPLPVPEPVIATTGAGGVPAVAVGATTTIGADPGNRCLLTWLGAVLGFAVVGVGLLYGDTLGGWLGSPFAFLPALFAAGTTAAGGGGAAAVAGWPAPALVTALPLAGAVGIIVGSVLPTRPAPASWLLLALLVGGLVYPLFGHWVSTPGWLAALGFIDASHAAGVATLGGVMGLVLAARLTPAPVATASAGLGTLPSAGPIRGVAALLIWFGWIGLASAADPGALPALVLATGIGAGAAVLAMVMIAILFGHDDGWDARLPTGLLAGAIAATAAYPISHALELVLLGLLTGLLCHLVLPRATRRLGPPAALAAAFAVAGFCGTLAPGALGADGLLALRVPQLMFPQVIGLVTAVVLAVVAALLLAVPARLLGGGRG